jgi:hypothetical protein
MLARLFTLKLLKVGIRYWRCIAFSFSYSRRIH